jgi:hypothetical protein
VLGLPRIAQDEGLAFSHGDARLTRELASGDIRAGFRRSGAWLIGNGCRAWLFGHTHRARVWTLGGADDSPRLRFDAASDPLPVTVALDGDAALWIVNAGSVGLPFPGKGPASATVLDTAAGLVDVFPV